MNTDFGSIEKSLNVETSIVPKEEPKKPELPNVVLKKGDVEKDYKYTRGQLYSLIEKGQEAINGIMEVEGASASPRADEVAGPVDRDFLHHSVSSGQSSLCRAGT